MPIQPSGRISRILSSSGPLLLVIPNEDDEYHLHAAIRLAHDLDVYHKLSVEITDAATALRRYSAGTLGTTNVVTIGGSGNAFARQILDRGSTPFKLTSDGSLTLNGRSIQKDLSSAFLHPHPTAGSSLLLVLYSGDREGTERLLRLFPIRTGIMVPDWIIIGKKADSTGAAGVEGAGYVNFQSRSRSRYLLTMNCRVWCNGWSWNEGLSFI